MIKNNNIELLLSQDDYIWRIISYLDIDSSFSIKCHHKLDWRVWSWDEHPKICDTIINIKTINWDSVSSGKRMDNKFLIKYHHKLDWKRFCNDNTYSGRRVPLPSSFNKIFPGEILGEDIL